MDTNTTGSTDAFIQQLALPKYYGLLLAPNPKPDGPLGTLAQKYGHAKDAAGGSSFGMGYAVGYLSGQALNGCGGSCSSSSIQAGLEKLSNVTVPNGALYGPVTFSADNHAGLKAVGFSGYDASTKGVVEAAVIKLPAPIY
jgi:hypothetical protein